MEHSVTTTDIIINLVIQVWQIAIFFGIFIYFIGGKIADAVITRQEKERKLAKADEEYQKIVLNANNKAEAIISDAMNHKKNLLEQAKELIEIEKNKIISNANSQAKLMLEKAEIEAANQKQDLESNFELAIKQIASKIVVKTIWENAELHDSYISQLVKDYKNNS